MNFTLPGAEPFSPETQRRLAAALAGKGSGYRARTRHLRPDGGPRYANRLLFESSPYLLQHAHNPVNWFPWGDEAFAAAARENRPVLLSVGYSTCHWCHVMEEESFEDEEIAATINRNYVPIKVDREERPDVDAVYMQAVQQMTGQGGWPMTVWLTPDKRPFFGGTYFPPHDGDRGSAIGFATLLARLSETWREQPERIAGAATQIGAALRRELAGGAGGDTVDADALQNAFHYYAQRFDAAHGGLAGAPKFPSGLPVRPLLRQHRRTRDAAALQMAVRTLRAMADGGMYDQIGGGFHRYAVDDAWLVPHFEKMLYDNALLAVAYVEGWQASGEPRFAETARDILRYVQRDMTSPDGAFYAATDADSAGPDGRAEEGLFFTWAPAEIDAALGEPAAGLIKDYYGVTAGGNFEGRNVLHVVRPLAQAARDRGLTADAAAALLRDARARLAEVRRQRPAPLRDEKILAGWNGLMISAFARAALAFDDESLAAVASRAADFLDERLGRDGRLQRVWKDGQARLPGYLSDYAFVIAANLDLYEATGDPRRLQRAVALDDVLERGFWDAAGGGFFTTSDEHETLPARDKPFYDGAEPSGNGVAIMNLLRLHEFTSDDRYRRLAEESIRAFGDILARAPMAMSETLLALDFRRDKPREIVIVTPAGDGLGARPFLDALRPRFLPNRILVTANEAEIATGLARLVPLAEFKTARNGRTTAYVCRRGVCGAPTTDPREFAAQLQ